MSRHRPSLRLLAALLPWMLLPAALGQPVVPLPGPAAVWRASCAYCHDHGIGPILGGRRLPPVATAMIVRQGARGMPAFHRSEIGEAELATLAAWVEAQPAPTGPSSASPVR